MLIRVLLTGLLPILLSWIENDRLPERKTLTDLLTQNRWILTSHGLDENSNDKIDPSEEIIEDCQKDNSTHFYPDGTGIYDDNILSCGNGIDHQAFNWMLSEDGTGIDFGNDSVTIVRLNERELVLCNELAFSNSDKKKYMLFYRH